MLSAQTLVRFLALPVCEAGRGGLGTAGTARPGGVARWPSTGCSTQGSPLSCLISPLALWVMGPRVTNPSTSGDTKPGGVGDTPEVCAAIRGDLSKLGTSLSSARGRAKSNPRHQDVLGLPREKPERDLGVLVGTRLNMSQESVLVGKPGQKLRHGRSPLDTRKCVFTVRVAKHWHGSPRADVEFPSLGILKNQLNMAVSNQLQEQGCLDKVK